MAGTCKYVYTPATGHIRGLRRTFREWLLMKLRKPEPMCFFATFNAPIYPKGHK